MTFLCSIGFRSDIIMRQHLNGICLHAYPKTTGYVVMESLAVPNFFDSCMHAYCVGPSFSST
jgi:hypothetical protein